MLEELKNLRQRNEELIHNNKECQTNTEKINQLEGELNKLREQFSIVNAQNIKLKQESEAKNQQLQENLPNLDLAKISIIQPAIKGTGDNKYVLLLLSIFA
jgi:predicted nuclease with TOPRIM domain